MRARITSLAAALAFAGLWPVVARGGDPSACFPLIGLAVTTEPAPAVAAQPLVLRLDGVSEGCAGFSVGSWSRSAEGLVVFLDYDSGCTVSPLPPSLSP